MKNISIQLTDWDCFVIRKAIENSFRAFMYHKKYNKKYARQIRAVYNNVHHNNHIIHCSIPTLRRIRSFTERFRNYSKNNNSTFGGNGYYDPAYFQPVINKLTYVYLKDQDVDADEYTAFIK